jgi:hypothetical protein
MTEDQGLRVLLDLLAKGDYAVDEGLVRGCSDIQRQFQFDRDREVPMDHMRRLVEAEVVRQMGDTIAQGGDE